MFQWTFQRSDAKNDIAVGAIDVRGYLLPYIIHYRGIWSKVSWYYANSFCRNLLLLTTLFIGLPQPTKSSCSFDMVAEASVSNRKKKQKIGNHWIQFLALQCWICTCHIFKRNSSTGSKLPPFVHLFRFLPVGSNHPVKYINLSSASQSYAPIDMLMGFWLPRRCVEWFKFHHTRGGQGSWRRSRPHGEILAGLSSYVCNLYSFLVNI